VGALDVLAGDDDGLAVGPVDRTFGEATEADLRTLQVGQDADRLLQRGGGFPHPRVALLVLRMLTVTEVQPGNVHAGCDQFADPLGAIDSGTQRADDLRATIHDVSLDSRYG
jgi:hypothetical protein